MRQADVRFYFDADVLGLAKVVCSLRSDSTYPGDSGAVIQRKSRPPCDIAPATPDSKWIPVVAARGWVVVTRDRNITAHPREIHAVRDSGAKLVVLSGKDATSTWLQLEALMSQWRQVEALRSAAGPLVTIATRTTWRHLDLET